MKALKSVEQAAELLGISPWTVRSYLKQGRLPAVRIGRRVLLQEEDLQQFVTASKAQPISRGSEQPASEGLQNA
jgi:excisionase family DNA binding protein